MFALLRLWILWRIARPLMPLLIALALLTALNAQTHRPPAIRPPHQLNGLLRTVRNDMAPLITRSQQALTNALLEGH